MFASHLLLLWWACIVLAMVGVSYLIKVRYRSHLRSIPGPYLASVTDLWRLIAVHHGRFDLSLRALHEKHGDLVRVGPNCISVADATEIGKIYSISRLFPKASFFPCWVLTPTPLSVVLFLTLPNGFAHQSDYYKVSQSIINGQRVASLFMITDENIHKAAKRPIAQAYAMTTLLDYEPYVDTTSTILLERLTTLFVKTNQICDFGKWVQWYAFDVIGEITFGRRLGFLEEGKDVGSLIDILCYAGWYAAVVGQMPWLDNYLEKNPLWLRYGRSRKLGVSRFVLGFIQDRVSKNDMTTDAVPDQQDETDARPQTDLLGKFMAAAAKYEGKIPTSQLLGWSLSNINAGSDTTAIALRAIFYYLLRTPRSMRRLQDEISAANLSELPKWKETSKLPYLGAVIKEAMRIHSPVGLILERVVPEGGVTICGRYLPEGTIVGCNPAVIGHSKKIYGQHYCVDQFWPERWLEADETLKAQMDRCFMAFGSGKRTCIGKNISLLEIHKFVPLLLTKFKITLANPEQEWKVWNSFFIHQKDFKVYLDLA